MSEEEERIERDIWMRRYYEGRRPMTSAAPSRDYYNKSRGYWYDPKDVGEESEMAFIRDQQMRDDLRMVDIRDTYRMMEEPMLARGTCTMGEILEKEVEKNEKEEEPEGEEFLFDPKELDV